MTLPDHVHAGGVDHLGTWRGKRFARATYERGAAGDGLPFSDVFWALTVAEDLVEPPTADHPRYFPRKETGFPDVLLRPDPATLRPVPWLDGEGWALGDWFLPEGRPVPLDPRAALRRLVAAAAERGLRVRAAFEYEFYLLEGTVADVAAGGFGADLPTAHTHPYTYHGQRAAQDRELLARLAAGLEGSGLALEAANCETGQSQVEVNVRYDDALKAADDAFLFKQAVKAMAAADGRTASFMAKPREDWAGSSCHVHVSLWSPDGAANLLEDGPPGHPNELAGPAIAGLLATLPAATAILCPTVNSAKRLAPYSWAATTVSWGLDNRSTALRTVGGDSGPLADRAPPARGRREPVPGARDDPGRDAARRRARPRGAAPHHGRRLRRSVAGHPARLARPRARRPGGRRRPGVAPRRRPRRPPVPRGARRGRPPPDSGVRLGAAPLPRALLS